MAGTDVAAGVSVDHSGTDAVLVSLRARKAVPIADFGAELEEQIGRRDPFHLQAVVAVLAAEKGLVGEWCIDEIPCMLVLLVHVAEPRKEASELRHQAVRRRRVHAIGLLDRDGILGRERDDQIAREQVIDIGGNGQLGLA